MPGSTRRPALARWDTGQICRYATHVVTAPEDPPQATASYRQNRFRVPPDATELLLVRHGESEAASLATPFPLLDGRSDPALAPEGRDQAELVAARLAAADVDAIYVSTLRRTVETAAPLAARLGLEPRVEAGLREVGLGEWEGGLFRKMVAEQHPTAMQMWAQESFEVIPGAEPAAEFAARVRDAVGRVAAAHQGQRVAVFTHGGVIGQVLALASGSRPFAFVTSDNGSISRIVVSGDSWFVRGFNDTAHLEPPPPA
jgi:2,3-bisphosphoglycerate-dependent phosphoglycerate mutase